MREPTEYEKQKWYSDYNYFDMEEDDFLNYGDELGEAFAAALGCTNKESYGLSDEFCKHAEVQALDMYYDQLLFFYIDQYESPEDYGLPSREVLIEKEKELGITGLGQYGNLTDGAKQLWDWAMEWREEHREETETELRIKRLETELSRLKG